MSALVRLSSDLGDSSVSVGGPGGSGIRIVGEGLGRAHVLLPKGQLRESSCPRGALAHPARSQPSSPEQKEG